MLPWKPGSWFFFFSVVLKQKSYQRVKKQKSLKTFVFLLQSSLKIRGAHRIKLCFRQNNSAKNLQSALKLKAKEKLWMIGLTAKVFERNLHWNITKKKKPQKQTKKMIFFLIVSWLLNHLELGRDSWGHKHVLLEGLVNYFWSKTFSSEKLTKLKKET